MIPETVPVWSIPLGWIASGALFTGLAHFHGWNRPAWGLLGLLLPFVAIIAYPINRVRHRFAAGGDA